MRSFRGSEALPYYAAKGHPNRRGFSGCTSMRRAIYPDETDRRHTSEQNLRDHFPAWRLYMHVICIVFSSRGDWWWSISAEANVSQSCSWSISRDFVPCWDLPILNRYHSPSMRWHADGKDSKRLSVGAYTIDCDGVCHTFQHLGFDKSGPSTDFHTQIKGSTQSSVREGKHWLMCLKKFMGQGNAFQNKKVCTT